MKLNLVGPFVVNAPFGTEIAFAKGLRRLGHEVHEVDPNVDRELRGLQNFADATVVFKSCVGGERFLKSLRHPIVVYQPDDARFTHIREMMLMMRGYADLFLSFDDHGASVARTMGYRAAETLLLTADDELYCPSPSPIRRDIDVSFIGSMADTVAHASRRKMLQIVGNHGTKLGWNLWFEVSQNIEHVRDIYRRSKVVLNHATDVGQPFGKGYGLQCRHFEVAMTHTPILSNEPFGHTDPPLNFPCFNDEDSLIRQVTSFVENTNVTDVIGADLYSQVRAQHMPEHRAMQLVDFISRNS